MPGFPGPAITTKAPWYTWPRIDNFGQKDPEGNYWKPDSNIQIPGNYPITALLPGVVTSVQRTTYGQSMVTIKLDSPLNSLATHTFYEHMSSATVTPGQHVPAGALIGYNNPNGQVPLGFGLYSGDVYGSGPEWQTLQSDLAPGGAQKLNPVALLNAASNRNPAIDGLTPSQIAQQSAQASQASQCAMWDIPCIWNTSIQPALVSFGEHIAIFVIALILIVVGVFLLAEKQAGQVVDKVTKAAIL